MRRIMLILSVAALLAAMVALSALPAFAASDNSSCKGTFFSEVLQPGTKGELISEVAKEQGGLGQFLGQPVRSCNPNANPKGGGA